MKSYGKLKKVIKCLYLIFSSLSLICLLIGLFDHFFIPFIFIFFFPLIFVMGIDKVISQLHLQDQHLTNLDSNNFIVLACENVANYLFNKLMTAKNNYFDIKNKENDELLFQISRNKKSVFLNSTINNLLLVDQNYLLNSKNKINMERFYIYEIKDLNHIESCINLVLNKYCKGDGKIKIIENE